MNKYNVLYFVIYIMFLGYWFLKCNVYLNYLGFFIKDEDILGFIFRNLDLIDLEWDLGICNWMGRKKGEKI